MAEIESFQRVLEFAQNQTLEHAVQDLRQAGIYIDVVKPYGDVEIVLPDVVGYFKSYQALLFAKTLVTICKQYIIAKNRDDRERILCTQACYRALSRICSGQRIYREEGLDILLYIAKQMEGYFMWPSGHILAK